MLEKSARQLLLIGLALLLPTLGKANATEQQPSSSTKNGMLVLGYQKIQIPGNQPIDLLGFHAFTPLNDWLYAGIGGHAPLVQGNYGGFMLADLSLHAQKRLSGPLFANAGMGYGGGAGGKSTEHAKALSGRGDFLKSYVGLGYDFKDFSAGLNWTSVRQSGSAIRNSQLEFFVQTPFSWSISPYASAGQSVPESERQAGQGDGAKVDETILEFGLDNFKQLKPQGNYRGIVNLADLQYSRFLTEHSYVLIEAGFGYRGLPTYNQIFGGLGYRYPLGPKLSVRGQLSIGSGGYDPERINTGPGLLVYPKVFLEYLLGENIGVSLTGGYLQAPKGTSRNLTFGALLSYHDGRGRRRPASASDAPSDEVFKGYRFKAFEQVEFDLRFRDERQASIRLLTVQLDKLIAKNFYVPVQGNVAQSKYFGYPGYSELLAGIGVQSEYSPHKRLQTFAQVMGGTNVLGLMMKASAGLDYALSDELALHAQIGSTLMKTSSRSDAQQGYRAVPTLGLGLSYRFSLAGGN